jgi:hypothetical protein
MVRLHAWLSVGVILSIAAVTGGAEAAKKKKPAPAPAPAAAPAEEAASDFDRAAAATAITEVSLAKCKATNATKGEGHVTITFAPTGSAQAAAVDKGPWVGTPVAKCMVKAFKKTKVPAFHGDAVTVGKIFKFE